MTVSDLPSPCWIRPLDKESPGGEAGIVLLVLGTRSRDDAILVPGRHPDGNEWRPITKLTPSEYSGDRITWKPLT